MVVLVKMLMTAAILISSLAKFGAEPGVSLLYHAPPLFPSRALVCALQ